MKVKFQIPAYLEFDLEVNDNTTSDNMCDFARKWLLENDIAFNGESVCAPKMGNVTYFCSGENLKNISIQEIESL